VKDRGLGGDSLDALTFFDWDLGYSKIILLKFRGSIIFYDEKMA